MNTPSQIYWIVAIAALAVVALLVFLVRKVKHEKRFSLLARLSFGFILAGIFFGSVEGLSYGLLGTGMVLAVIDILRRSRQQ